MIHLTRQEVKVLCLLTVLLITGLAVKAYRTAHPPVTASVIAKP